MTLSIRSRGLIAATALAGIAAISLPLLAAGGPDSGPVARYDMRAGTVSGMGGMGAMNPMAMMFGGGRGAQAQHELYLRLGSSTAPDKGKPKADHFMPNGAKLGKSVALVTPQQERGPVNELPNQKPKGRMLIYWGCGEHAPKGQPVVIDFSKLAAGQVPPGMWTNSIPADWGPNLANSKTFGRWPAEDGKYVKPDSSLLGAHHVEGNYSPAIDFTLTKDFMAPLSTGVAPQKSGASLLSWKGIAGATGYVATIFGGKQSASGDMGDMVMWSSSASRQFGGGLSDWLSPGQVAPLVKDGTLLGPQATSCIVPAEVIRDAPEFRFGTLTAFGPEESFAYPLKPADPKARWDLQWTARIRHRSMTSWMEAAGMPMMGQNDPGQQQQQQCKPKGGFGGLLGGALGGGNGC